MMRLEGGLPIRTHIALWSCLLAAAVGIAAQNPVNQAVSPDLFGELVDAVTAGYLHWSKATGDTVDPDQDAQDLDNSFGEHSGAVTAPSFSSRATAYGQGSVAEESTYAYGRNTVSWTFRVPGAGRYVLATRLWRELPEPTTAVISYRAGDRWVDLPPIGKLDHWGGFSRLACFLITVPQGQTTVPVRVRATSGRCLIRRVLLAKKRDGTPFAADAQPTHPSLYFKASDIEALRRKTRTGTPKLALDYMIGQTSWYTNSLNRGDKSWQPRGSSHHVPRSIAQTAFVAVLTGRSQHLDTVVRMMDTVMNWEVHADAIVDQKAGYNILGRARILSAMAMAYDWLHGKLPPRKRRRIRRFLDEEANRLFLYNETIAAQATSGNWDPWIGAGYGMIGIALRDEHAWASDWIDSQERIFRTNLHRSGEDFGYFNNGFVKALDFAICLRTAVGEDLFTPEAARLKALLDYRMMFLTPGGHGYPQFGDASGGNDPVLALCCAACLKDPMAQWFLNHMSCGTAGQIKGWGWNHMMPIAVAVLYDPELKEEAPSQPRLPLARSFARDPLIVPSLRATTILRTGYGQADDVQLAFRCADFAGWHGHPDQGSFVLNALGDALVIDRALGAPYGTPASTFSKSSLAHSIVLIDDRGQVPYSAPVFHDRSAGTTGPLLHTPFIDYVAADSTVAYRKNPRLRTMHHALRHFLFVRKPGRRAYVVVFDDVQVDQKLHAYDWLLQTTPKHTIEAKSPSHHVVRGKAELHVVTLEPRKVEMETSDHHNRWRTLKLMNPDDTKRGLFLNVLYPSAKGAPLPKVERNDGDGFIVAQVGEEELFFFATGSEPIEAHGLVTDAPIAALGYKDGKPAWFLCVEGSELVLEGKTIYQSGKKATVARAISP